MNAKEEKVYREIKDYLEKEYFPFWESHGIDVKYGGYLVCVDENGKTNENAEKQIVTQTRMIWSYSVFARKYGKKEYLKWAKQGVDFFIRHFWDSQYGGWYWSVNRDGSLIDDGKVVYGQTFAIYALSEYTLASGDPIGKEYACKTFDLLQKYCADTGFGGYRENMERDWSPSPSGFAAGDLKSLDIHMHTLEAFTTLYECTQEEIHRRKLLEVIQVILDHMVDMNAGCGRNQFTLDFTPKPAINIRRTWNAERGSNQVLSAPEDTTSYGHNVELAWLLNRAAQIAHLPEDTYHVIGKRLVDHALQYGFDYEHGGVFRDGPHTGAPLIRDKEWWQNCESLTGFLDAYQVFHEEKYLDALAKNWEFDTTYMINHDIGEWRQLVSEDGGVLIGQVGNVWKAMYHTGRAMLECVLRMEKDL